MKVKKDRKYICAEIELEIKFIPCNQTEISKSSKLVKEPSYFVHQNLDFTRVTSILSLLASQSNPSSIFSNLSRKPINFLSI